MRRTIRSSRREFDKVLGTVRGPVTGFSVATDENFTGSSKAPKSPVGRTEHVQSCDYPSRRRAKVAASPVFSGTPPQISFGTNQVVVIPRAAPPPPKLNYEASRG